MESVAGTCTGSSRFVCIVRYLVRCKPWTWIAAIFAVQTVGALIVTRLFRLAPNEVAMPIFLLVIGTVIALAFRHIDGDGEIGLWKWWIPLGIYALFIFLLSSRSYEHASIAFNTSLFHPVEYMTLGIFASWAWHHLLAKRSTLSLGLAVILSGLLFGVSDEVHQHYVPGRVMSLQDLCLDLLGLCVGFVMFLICRHIQRLFENRNNADSPGITASRSSGATSGPSKPGTL